MVDGIVLSLEVRCAREHVVGERGGLAHVEVERDRALEPAHGGGERRPVRDREHRVACRDDEGAHLSGPRRRDLVGEHAARQLAEDAGEVADAAPVLAVAVEAEAGDDVDEVDEALGEDRPARAVEVPGDDVQHLEAPGRQRPEAAADDPSDRFGAAGVVQSTAWGQLRPEDGKEFRELRIRIERRARRMLSFVANGRRVQGITKMAYKLARSRVQRAPVSASEWLALVSRSGAK